MTFNEAIDRARSRSLEVLRDFIADQEKLGAVHLEAAPRNAEGEIVFAPDGLRLPLRYDLVCQDASGTFHPRNAESITLEFTTPSFASWENRLRIEIQRLSWDFLSLTVSPNPGPDCSDELRRWFLKWFDPEDANPAGENGLFGVVHFISDPEIIGDTTRFFIDLGSAPTAALADLFDELTRLGFEHCFIGAPPG